jgi:hypothetical protein
MRVRSHFQNPQIVDNGLALSGADSASGLTLLLEIWEKLPKVEILFLVATLGKRRPEGPTLLFC